MRSREHDVNVREAAIDAARRAGLSLSEWLEETWRLHADEIRVHVDDLDEDERAYAVARQLERRMATGRGPRRADRDESAASRRSPSREEDRIWSRVTRTLNDMDVDEDRPQRRRPSARDDSWRDEPRSDDYRRDEPVRRTMPPRIRRSIDDVVEDITERQDELDFAPRTRRPRESFDDQPAAPMKRELSRLTSAIADIQRSTADSASAADVDSLRNDVAFIARGISALAPRSAVEGIELAVEDLRARLMDARAGGLVDDFITPVEALIADLKKAVLGAASANAMDAVEKRLGALARNVEALAETRIDPDYISNLLEHSQDIRQMVSAAAAKAPSGEALEKQIADLAGRIDRIAERGQTNAGLEAVTQSVAQIRSELEAQNPIKAVKALDGRIDALARKVDQAASRSDVAEHFAQLGQRLDAIHRDLADRAPERRKLEDMFHALQARIDLTRNATGPAEVRDIVRQLMGRLDQAIEAGADPRTVSALEDQITRMVERLDPLSDRRSETLAVQAAGITRIEESLGAIARRLEAPLPLSATTQIQDTVRLLVERFEASLQKGLNSETLGSIEQRLADVAERLEAPAPPDEGAARIETMIKDLAERVGDPKTPASDIADIKQTLARIAERMDAALRGEGDAPALRGVEQQISALTQRMESAAGGAAGGGALEREIANLRSMQSEADKRTHATLTAVHETLEKVVERLAMLEDEIDTPAKVEKPAPAAAPSLPRADDLLDYRPSIELNFGPPVAEPQAPEEKPAPPPPPAAAPIAPPAAAAPRAPVADSAPPLVAQRPSARRPEVSPAAPKLNGALADDFLLEPGSGKPSARVVSAALQAHQTASPPATAQKAAAPPAATAVDMPPPPPSASAAIDETPDAEPEADSGAQASFIAAVRRAQQQASAPLADAGADPSIDDARARARAAAAQAEAPQPKRAASGAISRAKSLLSARKSSTVASITGLAVILGALQAASMYYRASAPPAPQTAAQNQTPAAPAKSVARAEGPQLGAASPPAERFMQGTLTADMSPVASVPVNAAPAASTGAPSPQDPFALALAGDAHAQFEIGVRYADGRHTTRDPAKALEWLGKSAAQNFPPAQYRLGVIYEKGLGAPRDAARARTLYTAAAEAGNVKAMHNLGALLADGSIDGKPDYAGAAAWFRKAAEHGVRDSQYNLAILSARGLGVQQDLVQSYVWFSAAMAQGDADSGVKLKEVASRLDAAQLARAQGLAAGLRAKTINQAVNDPAEPRGGWAIAPEPKPGKPSASRSSKYSSLPAQ